MSCNRHYVYSSNLTIVTDHSALTLLLNSYTESSNRRLERWKIELSEYDFSIQYRKGTKYQNADALSRINPTSENTHHLISPDLFNE